MGCLILLILTSMHKVLLLLILNIFLVNAQNVLTDTTISLNELLEVHLFEGCIEVSNVSSFINGSQSGLSSFGTFTKSDSAFPFENGIILSTGDANYAGNSVVNQNLNQGTSDWGSDPDLDPYLSTNSFNATSVEFDIVSTTNFIEFQYILASEEYLQVDYICNNEDVFALLIKEANSSQPYINIATIGADNVLFSPGNIHPQIFGFCESENESYFDDYSIGDTNFDGRTVTNTSVAEVIPNTLYHVKLIIADGFDENFDSAVFLKTTTIEPYLDLGEDIIKCSNSVNLNANFQDEISSAIYDWYLNDELISANSGAEYIATESGNYSVKVEVSLNNIECELQDSINVTLTTEQSIGAISDFVVCESNGDEIEVFDLTIKNAEVIAAAPIANYTLSYHYSLEDAIANENTITTSIENNTNPQIVYVRLESESDCLAYSPINLVVNSKPALPELNPFIVCDNDSDRNEFTLLDIMSFSSSITGGDTNLEVSYYSSITDAETDTNPLASNFSASSIQLFARILDLTNDCYSIMPINFEVYNAPSISTTPIFIDACDNDLDGFSNFNLLEALPLLMDNFSGLSTSFHTSFANAQNSTFPIEVPSNYLNTTRYNQLIYIRVEDDVSGCFVIRSFEIHSNLLLSETNLMISYCDDNNDGLHAVDLLNLTNYIGNSLPNINITFFESLNDQLNNSPILSSSYTLTQSTTTLFINIENESCMERTVINLLLNEVIQFNSIPNQFVCDNNTDGFKLVDLSSLSEGIIENIEGFQVNYFDTLENAESNTSPLPNSYTNITNPQTIFVRISEDLTSCTDVSSFELIVIEAPSITSPSPIIVCDTDLDGFSIIDLNSIIPTLTDSSTEMSFHFFTSLQNATNEISPIINTNSFDTNTQQIYIRVEENSSTLNCPIIVPLDIIVNTLPVINNIQTYNVCVDDFNTPTYLFNTKDDEILNEQTGMEVFYYEDSSYNQLINKNQPYTANSFPETIFVKVDNITDSNCFSLDSFVIDITKVPEYNITNNIDVIKCDNGEIDGSVEIDFNEIIAKLNDGISSNPIFSFHTTLEHAENNSNPLPLNYENTTNPQILFVRIENSLNGCYLVESFGVNILSTPKVEQENNLINQCDTDFDGLNVFDISIYEINIFDVRQNFLESSYYHNLEDLENNTDEITNPEAFETTTNPEIVYIKVLNTVTQCYTSAALTLTSILPTEINTISSYEICVDEAENFELSEINDTLVSESNDLNISYYTTFNNAESKTDPISILNSEFAILSLFVRIETITTNCYYIHSFDFISRPLPVANQAENLENCDDGNDGELEFDLSQQTAQILGNQSPTNYSVEYYKTVADALNSSNSLGSIYNATNTETIIAKVTNNTTSCSSLTQFSLTVNRLPIVDISDQVICLDDLPLVVSAETFNTSDTYLWSTSQTSSEIIINEIGDYSVTVTSQKGCSNSDNFDVIESQKPIIEFTEVIGFTDQNSITIGVQGIGDYQFQLDNGPLQTSNFFNNVSTGYHTITVVDLNACNETTKQVLVINALKFFTPNGDGYFDTWNIVGIETLPGSSILIFDRFGKVLNKITHNSGGWNGTYNGNDMPSNDYWFLATIKTLEKTFEYKGHFTLKR